MVHSEEDVVQALATQFEENMRIDSEDNQHEATDVTKLRGPEIIAKPVFVKRKDRETAMLGPSRSKRN